MEDLDRPREAPGAVREILRMLEAFGFEWDGEILYQSARTEAYAQAIALLQRAGLMYPCSCSRAEIAAHGIAGVDAPVYPGTCRKRLVFAAHPPAWRVRTVEGLVRIGDRVQPALAQDLARDVGDFVLLRADGIHAYQLAVVVDDSYQGINQVVRGADLLSSTPRQAYLLEALGAPVPSYAHLPVVIDDCGRKLGKSHGAAPLSTATAIPTLIKAWDFLGQRPFPEVPANIQEFWSYAQSSWDIGLVPNLATKSISAACST
jgi:glutamyl-Q tRNA(Asp) synthetase